MNEQLLELKYIRRENFVGHPDNAKQHDIGSLIELILEHGFRIPLTINQLIDESHLTPLHKTLVEDGQEVVSIIAGHGRLEAAYHIELMIKKGEKELPSGLQIDPDGMLLLPSILGEEITDIEQFTALLVDDNNITVAGSNMTAVDMSRLYDMNAYLKLLKTSINKTKTVDGDDLDLLLQLHGGQYADIEDVPEEDALIDDKPKSYGYNIKFDNEIDLRDFKQYLSDKREDYPSNTNDAFILLDAVGLV